MLARGRWKRVHRTLGGSAGCAGTWAHSNVLDGFDIVTERESQECIGT